MIISIFFNWYLAKQGHNLYGNYNSENKSGQLSWQKLQNSSHDQFAYQVTARNDIGGTSMEVDTNYSHQRIEIGFRHAQSSSNDSDWNYYSGRLKLGAAIGIVGGQLSVGRPVSDGFAIIHRDEHSAKQDIRINKTSDRIKK